MMCVYGVWCVCVCVSGACAGATPGLVQSCESFTVPFPITNKPQTKEVIRTAATMLYFRFLHKTYLNEVT